MLTVDYDRLGLAPGDRLLDLGCGAGRHAFEALRRGARVVAFDYDEAELKDVGTMAAAMDAAGDIPASGRSTTTCGDATRLPFPDGSFDRVIAAEVLEHIADDGAAIHELARVLRPGGTMAVTVPAWLAERICWALSDEYHAPFVERGHVRIYKRSELRAKLRWALDRSDLRQTVGAAGRQRVVDQWSWRHTALKTVEQYRLLLDQRSSSASTERRA